MKKLFSFTLIGTESIIRLALFILGIGLILAISYLLGYQYLQALQGNDTFYHLSNIFWFDKYFPKIPFWYPLQNGGVVPIWGYPYLSYLLVILLHRLSVLSLTSAFQIIGFLSVPLTALGLYLYVWTRLKNQTAALVGSIFYVLAPISWAWLFDWGFYTESVSYIFIFPFLIFYDLFLTSYLKNKINFFSRLTFVLAVLFTSITFFTHPTTFFVELVIALSLTIFQVLSIQRKPFLNTLKKIFIPFISCLIVTLLLISFLFIDFYQYSKNGVGSTPTDSYKQEFLQLYATPVDSLLGLGKISTTDFKYTHRNLVVPLSVWIPAIIGLIAAALISRQVLALALLALLPIVLFQWPIIAWYIIKTTPFSYQVLHHRAVLVFLRTLIPIVGAYGIWALSRFILEIPLFWIKKGRLLTIKKSTLNLLSAILSLTIALSLIIYFSNKPTSLWRNTDIRYGPKSFDIRAPFESTAPFDPCLSLQPTDPGRPKACQIDFINKNLDIYQLLLACNKLPNSDKLPICDQLFKGSITQSQFNDFLLSCQQASKTDLCRFIKRADLALLKNNLSDINKWPKPALIDNFVSPFNQFSKFITLHKNDKMLRIDVSPYLGGVVQTLNLNSEISQINLYAITLSLLGPYWGYEQQVFFSPNTGNTTNVNNLAQWFGTKYLLMEKQLDPISKYKNDPKNWKLIDEDGAWQFLNAPQMYSWTLKKPTALLIGSQKKRAYEPWFRVAVSGAMSYDNAWLVQGKENIDDYTLEELKRFDTLILFGYSYKNQSSAFNLLDKYLKSGGKVFLDTGWQYTDKDFQIKKAPEFFPVNDLVWSTSYDKSSKYQIEDPEIQKQLDLSKFSPLTWDNQSWGVSVPSTSTKPWAKPLLTIDGKPLVLLGNYGQGKILWSGLNWMGHISTYDFNPEEIKFLNLTLTKLMDSSTEDEAKQSAKVTASRDYPDRVEFTFLEQTNTTSTFYWRETQFENWHASLVSPNGNKTEVQIYRAGPGFMLMRLPQTENGTKLILEFQTSFRTYFAFLISALTVLGLLIYLIRGSKLTLAVAKPLSKLAKTLQNKLSISITKWWKKSEEEEDY